MEPRSQDRRVFPLGDCWSGICCALRDAPVPAEDGMLAPVCNMGYARGRCRRFPPNEGPDAVRFAVKEDDGSSVRIAYVVESNHHPFAHGVLQYSRERRALIGSPPAESLARQAAAYAESYLRRKSNPERA